MEEKFSKKHWGNWNDGENEVEKNYGKAKKTRNYDIDVDRWESNAEEVASNNGKTMEKQWKNCGFDGTSIESKYSQKTMESANETVDTVQRLGLVCRGRCISVLVEMCHALGTATRVFINVFFGILWERRIEGV